MKFYKKGLSWKHSAQSRVHWLSNSWCRQLSDRSLNSHSVPSALSGYHWCSFTRLIFLLERLCTKRVGLWGHEGWRAYKELFNCYCALSHWGNPPWLTTWAANTYTDKLLNCTPNYIVLKVFAGWVGEQRDQFLVDYCHNLNKTEALVLWLRNQNISITTESFSTLQRPGAKSLISWHL